MSTGSARGCQITLTFWGTACYTAVPRVCRKALGFLERKGFSGGPLADPDDRERKGAKDDGRSNLARNLRLAERYTGASFALVAAVGLFSWLGYKLDQKFGHKVPWLLLVGAAVGMIGGFVSFFRTVLGTKDKDK